LYQDKHNKQLKIKKKYMGTTN